MSVSSTIAAIATPAGNGGLSVIRVSGAQALKVAARCFAPFGKKELSSLAGYQAAYGMFLDANGKRLDDGIALIFRAPHSYTGEDTAELSCHGGAYVARRILRRCLEEGARLAQPGEFTRRAFENGKMDLAQAEAVSEIIGAQNAQALRCAQAQRGGALSKQVEACKSTLLKLCAYLGAWADYPEEDIPILKKDALRESLSQAEEHLSSLLDGYDNGRMLCRGIETVIVGKPNVGKSTLMNLLSGEQRSIVTDVAGTTRDIVCQSVQLGDLQLNLSDTAGIHETGDRVEKIGVDLARKKMESADLILAVFDSSRPFSADDKQILEDVSALSAPALAIVHKTDLPSLLEESKLVGGFQEIVHTSVENPESLPCLQKAIEALLHLTRLEENTAVLLNERQRGCAVRARDHVRQAKNALLAGFTLDAVSIDLDDAVSALLELTGERASEVIVEEIFHRFCVGK